MYHRGVDAGFRHWMRVRNHSDVDPSTSLGSLMSSAILLHLSTNTYDTLPSRLMLLFSLRPTASYSWEPERLTHLNEARHRITANTPSPSAREDTPHSFRSQLISRIPHLGITLPHELRRTKLMDPISLWMISFVAWDDTPN